MLVGVYKRNFSILTNNEHIYNKYNNKLTIFYFEHDLYILINFYLNGLNSIYIILIRSDKMKHACVPVRTRQTELQFLTHEHALA